MDNERIPTMPQGMESERIPTMPQGMESERIPTMPQGMESERIPTMPQGMEGERVPTMPQGAEGERIATLPQGVRSAEVRVATMPQQSAAASTAGGRFVVTQNISFQGDKGGSFLIEASDIISADSGESQIYGCRMTGDTQKYVARVLLSVTPDSEPAKLQTREKVIYFLDVAGTNPHNHILPLVDHATVQISGKKYFVEVYPYCEEGDLGRRKGKISYAELTGKIIPAINEALKAFHTMGLVHRDVKPDNLYYYNGNVVIGDFGITCDLREDGFATDRYKTGTLGYYAPELMSQAAIKASDYYSFGQTIWTLYSGEMMYRNILRMYREQGVEEQRNQINFAMLNSQYYGLDELGKEDAFLEVLIRGLLQYDPKERFDYEKVNRWLAGDKSLSKEIVNYRDDSIFTREFVVCGKGCWDSTEVYKVLCDNWEEAKELLYSGVLKDFYASQNFEAARFFDGIMKKYMYHEDPELIDFTNDIGLAKVIMYLSANRILCWLGEVYETLEDISMAAFQWLGKIINGEERNHAIYSMLIYSDLMRDWYATKKNVKQEVLTILNDLRELQSIGETGNAVAYMWLCCCFLKNPHALDYKDCHNLAELTEYFTAEGNIYVSNGQSIFTDLNFLSTLCVYGYQDMVKVLLRAEKKSLCERYEMLFDFLESNTEGETREHLRIHYNNYGPRSQYFWWQNHLNLYEFEGENALLLREKILAVYSLPVMSLQEQRKALAELAKLYLNFRQYDVSDIFLAELGILVPNGDDMIRATRMEGVWNYMFLGNAAPIGYKYYIEM